ncbi:ubiquinol oxidase subunit II [Paenibacillus sp. GCM10023250]|uniref:ubiquinol oxidase subunit II n=1 Tax=Paenibacillus sp. GCM10023250 TaxID=3252648 RepID=UPI00361A7B8B
MCNTKLRRWCSCLAVTAVMLLVFTGCSNAGVLDPKGPIAEQQRDLMYLSTALCAIVIVPVLVLSGIIIWRYRDRAGRQAKYAPNWAHSTKLEIVWWGIPIIVILAIAIVTARATYALEPSKPIRSEVKPLTVQVTSLNWKWLFQYPEQGIAAVNELKLPQGVPVRFEITADSPMNSFWIPQLGGQIYAMSGMAMTLYLQADELGTYAGYGANFTGTDFAKMVFDVEAVTPERFNQWVSEVKADSPALTQAGYEQLAKPASSKVLTYSSFPDGLFDKIVRKYAGHAHGRPDTPKHDDTGGHAMNHMPDMPDMPDMPMDN